MAKEPKSRREKLKAVEMAARDRHIDVHRFLVEIDRQIPAMQELVWPSWTAQTCSQNCSHQARHG